MALDEETLEATRYFGVRIPTLQLVRITRRHQPGRNAHRVMSLLGPVLPELIRSGWTPRLEACHPSEHRDIGIEKVSSRSTLRCACSHVCLVATAWPVRA